MHITSLIRKWCEEVARTQPGSVGEQVAFDYLCTAMNIQVAVDAARDSTTVVMKREGLMNDDLTTRCQDVMLKTIPPERVIRFKDGTAYIPLSRAAATMAKEIERHTKYQITVNDDFVYKMNGTLWRDCPAESIAEAERRIRAGAFIARGEDR